MLEEADGKAIAVEDESDEDESEEEDDELSSINCALLLLTMLLAPVELAMLDESEDEEAASETEESELLTQPDDETGLLDTPVLLWLLVRTLDDRAPADELLGSDDTELEVREVA